MTTAIIEQAPQMDLEAQTKQAFKKLGKSVCILSCFSDGQRHASVATAVCNVSNAPPSLLICLEKSASLAVLLLENSSFAVNVLGADQQGTLEHCMQNQGAQRFGHGAWSTHTDQTPLLLGSQAIFCCRVAQVNSFETHYILTARIDESHCSDNSNGLIYLDGTFHSIETP